MYSILGDTEILDSGQQEGHSMNINISLKLEALRVLLLLCTE
jgi:hypothetical protein